MQCRYQVGEVLTAYKLLSRMSTGEHVSGLSLSGSLNTHSSLKPGADLLSDIPVACRYRVGEVLTAYKLLSSMSKGQHVPGLSLSGGLSSDTLLAGQTSHLCPAVHRQLGSSSIAVRFVCRAQGTCKLKHRYAFCVLCMRAPGGQ